jgi:hypothetical protein
MGAMAVAAGLVAVPAALAAPGHHAPKVRYDVTGLATSPATGTLNLSGVKYHPKSLGTSATLVVNLSSATKYANRRNRPIPQAKIKPGDRIEVKWVEAAGTTPSTSAVATEVVDLGPASPIRYDVTGVSTTSNPTTSLGLSGVKYHPKSLGTSATLTVTVGTSTKFANRHGKAIAESKITSGDRIEVVWVEPAITTPSTALTATKVIDLGPPPPIRYDVTGRATTAASTTLGLSGVKYHPKSLGTSATLTVGIGTSTKYANRHGKVIAEGSIKAGDRIEVVWVEPSATTPSTGLTATKVIDLSRH